VLLQQLVESDLAVRLRSRNIVTSAFRKNSNTEEGEHPTVTRNFREDYIYWQKQKGALISESASGLLLSDHGNRLKGPAAELLRVHGGS